MDPFCFADTGGHVTTIAVIHDDVEHFVIGLARSWYDEAFFVANNERMPKSLQHIDLEQIVNSARKCNENLRICFYPLFGSQAVRVDLLDHILLFVLLVSDQIHHSKVTSANGLDNVI